jgi:phosphatidylethanolamine-binding protein (PEBP) family uncharacterized protein
MTNSNIHHHRERETCAAPASPLSKRSRVDLEPVRRASLLLILAGVTTILAGCSKDHDTVAGPTTEDPTNPPGDRYTIEQTLSDEAQRNTIAFDGLAFLTGSLGSQSFLPPGKVADFSGFQYLRDNDPTSMGHNTDFVTIIAFNMLNILTADQIDRLVASAQVQVQQINDFAYGRFPLLKALRRHLEGDLPDGTTGLDSSAVVAYTADLYRLDGRISYSRARLMGGILTSLTPAQKAALDALKGLNGVGNWNRTLPDPLQSLHLDHDVNVAVMTYASEMYSWYAGSVEADVYFCPERQGTYFGSFYLKDWPAMGNPDYTIDEQLTARAGQNFLAALSAPQAALVTGLVDVQRSALREAVDRRRDIATQLRRFMRGESVDSTAVLDLSASYGELDGQIAYWYATRFASVAGALSGQQRTQLESLADGLGYLSPAGAFLYSQPIPMPTVASTDFLFGAQETASFILGSTEVAEGGALPADYTCDGSGATLPLEWTGAPEGTQSFAVVMHHVDPEGAIKWYWILYDIPASVTALPRNVTAVGTLGNNSVNGSTAYAPPCSQGPGPKAYAYTVYALSSPPQITVPPSEVNREVLLAAISDRTLASAALNVIYTR